MEVRPAADDEEVGAALGLRERVFHGEQGVAVEADRDGRDPEALHVVALDGGELIGTCRLLFADGTARLGRMAVARERRGEGVGGAILAVAERLGRERGATSVRLHAQTAVESFYSAAGYASSGEPFDEEGIPHVAMEKPL